MGLLPAAAHLHCAAVVSSLDAIVTFSLQFAFQYGTAAIHGCVLQWVISQIVRALGSNLTLTGCRQTGDFGTSGTLRSLALRYALNFWFFRTKDTIRCPERR